MHTSSTTSYSTTRPANYWFTMSMKSGADPGFCQDEVTASEDKSCKAEDWGVTGVKGLLSFQCSNIYHILQALLFIFLPFSWTPNIDKNSILYYTILYYCISILRYFCVITHFENLYFLKFLWKCYTFDYATKQSEARNFYDVSGDKYGIVWLVTHCFSLKSQSISCKWKFTF